MTFVVVRVIERDNLMMYVVKFLCRIETKVRYVTLGSKAFRTGFNVTDDLSKAYRFTRGHAERFVEQNAHHYPDHKFEIAEDETSNDLYQPNR